MSGDTSHKTHIVVPVSKLMGGPETMALRKRIDRSVRHGASEVVLDLSRVQWANCAGIGCLVGALRRLRSVGGSVYLKSPSFMVRKLLDVTDLSGFFRVIDSGETGLPGTTTNLGVDSTGKN